MNSIARIINGLTSVSGILLGLLCFLLSGIASSFFPGMAGFAALVAALPVVIVFISVVGLYGVIKNNIKVQIAFDVCLLPAWHVGTLIGAISLLLFFIGNKNALKILRLRRADHV